MLGVMLVFINGKRGITVQNCNSNLKKYVSATNNVLQFYKLFSKTLEIGVYFYLVQQLHIWRLIYVSHQHTTL